MHLALQPKVATLHSVLVAKNERDLQSAATSLRLGEGTIVSHVMLFRVALAN